MCPGVCCMSDLTVAVLSSVQDHHQSGGSDRSSAVFSEQRGAEDGLSRRRRSSLQPGDGPEGGAGGECQRSNVMSPTLTHIF